MITDQQFFKELQDMDKEFSGWDFSFITGTGRMQEGLLTWSYGSMARRSVQQSDSMLDMGTGSGEFLSMLRPFPKKVCATEGYKPNVPIAKKRLEPLGVEVIPIEEDVNLPLADNQFDLILNKHESYNPAELRRMISDDGIFLTQQVGGLNDHQINENLDVPINEEFRDWNLSSALKKINQGGFRVEFCKEEFPVQRYYDIGALIYYLKAIPWQIPNFNVDNYLDELFQAHRIIQTTGYFEVNQHRFIIKAKAI